jgi:hypothetical protein
MTKKTNWIPEIMYEESDDTGTSSNIPFVMVPKDQTMPKLLYIFESRDTGELEPGSDGNPVPVFEWDLHQYADLLTLKNHLDETTYDIVRNALGLEPLRSAIEKGKAISQKINVNLNSK